jgi:transposase
MMGQVEHQEQLFYRLRLEDYIPEDHLLRHVDRFVDFSDLSHRAGRALQPHRPPLS